MFEFPLLPDRASTIAGQVDAVFWVMVAFATLSFLIVAAAVLLVIAQVKRGSAATRPVAAGGRQNEQRLVIAATILPLLVAVGLFAWSAEVRSTIAQPPAQAVEIQVVGKQGLWKFQHENGRREIDELHIPVGTPIKLNMISQDVIHQLYVPAFRIQQEVLPGEYTTAWFEASQVGEYHLFCTKYAEMTGTIVAMAPADYETWLAGAGAIAGDPNSAGTSAVAAGAALFEQLGCASCHVADGTGVGPSLKNVFGQQVTLENGETVTADEAYLTESILNPTAKVVQGYAPIMPPFEGLLNEDQALQLINYIKSLAAGEN